MSKFIKLFVLLLIGICMMQAVACSIPEIGDIKLVVLTPTKEEASIAPTNTAQPEPKATNTAQPPTPTPTEEPPLLMPGEPPEAERTLKDSDASIRAQEKRVLSGDKFLENLFERPFTSEDMIYQPELDIYTVDIAEDDNFFYFTIILNPINAESPGLIGTYGVEFDRTKTGRGDLIVLVDKLEKDWSIKGVKVFTDGDTDVGGPNPMLADEGFEGNGYDTQVKLEGDKVAFARVSPDDPDTVQIAVSRALLDNTGEFLWSAWADNGLKDVTRFDYNDTMGLHTAGSPFIDDEDYPIKDLYSLDNTCRLPYGFTQTATIPGVCKTAGPAAGTGCDMVCVAWGADPQGVKICIKYECQ